MNKKVIFIIAFLFLSILPFRVNAMKLFVKLNEAEKYTFELESNTTIEDIKYRIYDKSSIPREFQILKYNSVVLEDNRILTDYNIQEGYTIDLDAQGVVVDGESLTSKNPNNSLNTAVYNVENKTLTLNKYNGGSIEYYGEDKLNIILKNSNSITLEELYSGYGISSLIGDIKFSGDGSLTISDSVGAIYSYKNVEIDNTTIVIDNALAGGIITYGKTIINGDLDIQSFVFPIMTESDVIINGGNIDLKSDTMGIFVTGNGSLYINGGSINILSGEKDAGAAILVLKNTDGQGIFIDDDVYFVQDGISIQEADVEYNSENYTGYTYGSAGANILIYEMFVESTNVANDLNIKKYSYKFTDGNNQELTVGNIESYTLIIDGNHALFDSLKIGNLNLVKNEDYEITEGSTVITFTDKGIAKLGTLPKGEYQILAKYTNGKEVKGKVTINSEIGNPKTSDNFIVYLITSVISLMAILFYTKSKNN